MSTILIAEPAGATPVGSAGPACSLCGSASHTLFEKHGVPISQCAACCHRFAVPVETEGHIDRIYDDGYFFGGGAGYDDYLSEAALLQAHGRRYARRIARDTQRGTMLDVGAAAGFVLQGFCEEGWAGQGLEPNDAVANLGREKLGLTIHTGSLEEFESDEMFDLVSLIQVIGHFVNPREAASRVASLVKPGGHCLIETWNVRSLTARLFGHSWHEYSPPSVLQWFSPKTVVALFQPFGLRPVAKGIPQKWLNAGHAKSLLRHKASESGFAYRASTCASVLPDRLNLPYPSEDLFWMLLRKEA